MLEPEQELAHGYRLMERLGGRNAAPVWLAAGPGSSSHVVLKFFPIADANSVRQQFDDLRLLQHPGILQPAELVADGEQLFMVLPLAAQGDLGQQRGRPCGAWFEALRELARALDYLHQQGFVHGDVKTANVLLDAGGHVQLADFELLRRGGTARSAADWYSPGSASPRQRAAAAAECSDDIYAFGALLHELLCARLPAAGDSEPAAIVPSQPAPQQLLDLCRRCLALSSAARPQSMQEVITILDSQAAAIAALPARASTPILTPPTASASVLQPQWQRSASPPPLVADARAVRRQGFRQGMLAAAGLALAVLAVMLFVAPERLPGVPARPTSAPAAAAAIPAAKPESAPEEQDLQALAREKSRAESAYEAATARLNALTAADAASWGAESMATAARQLATIDSLMQQLKYTAATAAITPLASTLTVLEAARPQALRAALQSGAAALLQHDAIAAAAAYAQALKIEPANATAQTGARRAATHDAVLAATVTGRTHEQAGRVSDAAASYRQALALDPTAADARLGLARTGSQLAADQFGRTMARGYTALGARQFAAARSAFVAAQAMRADDPEIARALGQLAAAESAETLSATLAGASAAADREAWAEAAAQYQKALAIDSTLVAAREQLALTTARATLDAELRQLIAAPERAYSAPVHSAGVATLQRARGVATPGPVLSTQIARAVEVLAQAETPIPVALRSDNLTQVTVSRVGVLGNFSERVLQLKPGHYVVVGTRTGYRDVRRELDVAAGRELPALQILCNEAI